MTIAFSIGGSQVSVPATYSTLTVQDSLLNVAPGVRNIVLVGEAASGIPQNLISIGQNFFTDFGSLQNFYVSGPVVDAASQIFRQQPSAAFTGTVNRVYVAKTNQSTRAAKLIASPSGYGSLVAAEFGADGNMVKTQIQTASVEILPTVTFAWLPSFLASSLGVSVDGETIASPVSFTHSTYATAVSALNTALSGKGTATGGTVGAPVPSGTPAITITIPATPDGTLTMTMAAQWTAGTMDVGNVVIIDSTADAGISGAGGANMGAYLVTASTYGTTSTATLLKLLGYNAGGTADATFVLPVASTDATAATTAFASLTPVTVTVTQATVAGQAASLELNGGLHLVGGFIQAAKRQSVFSLSAAIPAAVSATATGSSLSVSVVSATFTVVPKVGDVVSVPVGSPIAGGSNQNVGQYVVTAGSPYQITMTQMSSLSPVSVALTNVNSNQNTMQVQTGFQTFAGSGRTVVSASQNQVALNAIDVVSGATLPQTPIGGRVALELAYWSNAATTATASITQTKRLQVTVSGSGLVVDVPLGKYPTVGTLVTYLNSITGMSARVGNTSLTSLPPTNLDEVANVGILGTSADSAYNGKIKVDYYDWTQYFVNNFSLVSFRPGSLTLTAGLPAAESVATFLQGGTLGGTSNANIQSALDATINLPCTQVVSLFSRDAAQDVTDDLTDPTSTYTIASINASVVANVASAWAVTRQKERIGEISFYGAFTDCQAAAEVLNYQYVQMCFQLIQAVGADGTLQTFLPWMGSAMIAAGRAQSALGTSMLRKQFNIQGVASLGNVSIFTDTTAQDFDPTDFAQLTTAISAGLVTFGSIPNQGIRMLSPDLSTYSRINDPKEWFYGRTNVEFVLIEVMQTTRSVLDNYIGSRTSDTSPAVIQAAVSGSLNAFVNNGSVLSYRVGLPISTGNGYKVALKVQPTEAVEFIELDVLAVRQITD